ncbi:hypothetical protein DFH07DRAFT_788190 [Mycena maculata]|uniref:Uncharacterized protein n=1 Tax=Mycena maculata TaxID=230809 RepID=A0AAD7KE77_9AGAR|nr:hypothetical protein DFH07DRAFT_788190 [Mycena maculata]
MSANTSAPNRASLLSGLRTGGVRSSSIPHTAAPGGTFNIPRVALNQSSIFPEEDTEQAQFAQNVFAQRGVNRAMPMTAAVDGPNNRFMQQQQDVNPNIGSFSPAFAAQPNHVQAQALQMQMMQLEIIRMQTIQAQQYQAQLLAQSQQSARRPNFNPPATAGPTGSFDLRSATLSAQMRRTAQGDDQVPMTAALGGKFGGRASSGPMGRFSTEDYDDASVPPTPNSTTVISGGTSLGTPTPTTNSVVSKSETASNWRRGGNNSVLRGANRPTVGKTSPPPTERRLSPPPAPAAHIGKFRPQPLHFNGAASQPMPAVAIDTSEGENDDGYSTSSSDSAASNSPPTTPRSSSSIEISVSPPKDGAKVMPAGLGFGHPTSVVVQKVVSHRLASQPMRQPRGPPSGPEELGSRNFASRMVAVA